MRAFKTAVNAITIEFGNPGEVFDLADKLVFYDDSWYYHECLVCGVEVPVEPEDHKEGCLVALLKKTYNELKASVS